MAAGEDDAVGEEGIVENGDPAETGVRHRADVEVDRDQVASDVDHRADARAVAARPVAAALVEPALAARQAHARVRVVARRLVERRAVRVLGTRERAAGAIRARHVVVTEEEARDPADERVARLRHRVRVQLPPPLAREAPRPPRVPMVVPDHLVAADVSVHVASQVEVERQHERRLHEIGEHLRRPVDGAVGEVLERVAAKVGVRRARLELDQPAAAVAEEELVEAEDVPSVPVLVRRRLEGEFARRPGGRGWRRRRRGRRRRRRRRRRNLWAPRPAVAAVGAHFAAEVEVAVGAAVVAAMAVVGELRVVRARVLADRQRAVGAVHRIRHGAVRRHPRVGLHDPEHGTVLDGPRVPVLQTPLNVGGLRAAALRRRGLGPDVEALRRDAGADEPHRAVGRQPRDPGEEHALPAAVGVGAAHPRALPIEEEGAHLLQVDVHVAVGVDDVDELVEAHRRQLRAASSGQPFVEEREEECDERREVALPLLQIINRALHVDDVVEDPPAARAAG